MKRKENQKCAKSGVSRVAVVELEVRRTRLPPRVHPHPGGLEQDATSLCTVTSSTRKYRDYNS